MVEWWRSAIVWAIHLAVAAVLFVLVELSGLLDAIFKTGFFSEPWIHFFAMVFVAIFLTYQIRNQIAKVIFKHHHRAWRLSQQGAHVEAADAYREQIAFLERHPWIDPLRTVILLDTYKEGLIERTWVILAHLHWWHGDRAQAVDCYEKSVAVSPGSFTGLYALSVIGAQMGQPSRPFKIPPQQIAYGSGWMFFFVLLIIFNCCVSQVFGFVLIVADFVGASSALWNVGLGILMLVVFMRIPETALGWLINQVVQAGHHSAYRMAAAGDFEGAARAFEQDVKYWRDRPDLQKFQKFLFDKTPQSYLERALRMQAIVAIRMGKPEVFVSAYKEILAINPESDVRSWLKLYEDEGPAEKAV